MRVAVLATIVAFFASSAQAFDPVVVQETCSTWAEFTYNAATAQSVHPEAEYRKGMAEVIGAEKDEQTAKVMTQIVAFVAVNQHIAPMDLARAVYQECVIKLSGLKAV